MSLEVAVEKRFGASFRLAVDFRCGDGILGILGASGSGKSMILRCVAGIETPDAGRIAANGRVLFDSSARVNVRPQRRRVGYLFQNYALFPNMTVEGNVGVAANGAPAERERTVAALLRRFRLEGLEKRYPEQLSGGQRQRAALARMLAADPEVILLDEPFSALDAHLREQMQLELLEALAGRRDVIMVTHSRDEAYRMCSDLLVLDDGRALAFGGTRALFADPGHVRVARVSGCKNISRLEKLSARTFRAADWGTTLAADGEVPDWAEFVGIRAHDLQPVAADAKGLDNVAAVRMVERVEDMFESNLLFVAEDGLAGGVLWWKCGRAAAVAPPSRLRFPPSALLFLRGD